MIPCIEICDANACPCTCPPSEYSHLRNDTNLEFSIGGDAEDMAQLSSFAMGDEEPLMVLAFKYVPSGLAIIGVMVVSYMLFNTLFTCCNKDRDGFMPIESIDDDATSAPYGSIIPIDSTTHLALSFPSTQKAHDCQNGNLC